MLSHPASDAAAGALLLLLRAGLYEAPQLLGGFAPLSPGEWEEIYAAAKRQTVSGVIYHALAMLPDSLLPPTELLLRWVARAHRIETSFACMSDALASLMRLFGEAGFSPVLQKGHGVARFYAVPSLRVSGDIDFFFPEESRRRADKVVAAAGAAPRRAPDGSSRYAWRGVEVEHHGALVQLGSPLRRNALRRLIAAEGTRQAYVAPGLMAPVPAPLVNLVMVNVHIMKHCLGVGMGLRHFCDYSLAYAALIPEIGVERYRETCRSLGILRWTDVLHAFVNDVLPPPGAPLPALGRGASGHALRTLQTLVKEGGNFGLYRAPAESAPRAEWLRKMGTLSSFLRHSGFAMRVAPAEALCMIMKLTRGQMDL